MTRTADAVIVGGGCMGASVAFHLTQLGITNVVLVERDTQLGTGSTGRNAGGVRHQFSHDANIRLSLESIAVLERFEDTRASRPICIRTGTCSCCPRLPVSRRSAATLHCSAAMAWTSTG